MSPITELCAWIENTNYQGFSLFLDCVTPSDAGNGYISGSFTLNQYLQPSNYLISQVQIKDSFGNVASLDYTGTSSTGTYAVNGYPINQDATLFDILNQAKCLIIKHPI